jgi:hypothetical protein
MFGINVFPKTKTLNLTEFLLENSVSYSLLEENDDIINAFSRTYGEEINVIPTIFIINKKREIAKRIIEARKKEVYRTIIIKYL